MIAAWLGKEQVPSASHEPEAVRVALNIKADEIQVAGVLEHAIGHPPIPTLICVALTQQKNAGVHSGFCTFSGLK